MNTKEISPTKTPLSSDQIAAYRDELEFKKKNVMTLGYGLLAVFIIPLLPAVFSEKSRATIFSLLEVLESGYFIPIIMFTIAYLAGSGALDYFILSSSKAQRSELNRIILCPLMTLLVFFSACAFLYGPSFSESDYPPLPEGVSRILLIYLVAIIVMPITDMLVIQYSRIKSKIAENLALLEPATKEEIIAASSFAKGDDENVNAYRLAVLDEERDFIHADIENMRLIRQKSLDFEKAQHEDAEFEAAMRVMTSKS